MKKILMMLVCIWIISISAEAPPTHIEYTLPEPKIEYPFGIEDTVLLSFIRLESNFNEKAVNPVTGARGILQILPVMVAEANRLQAIHGKSLVYTWDDAWDVAKSIEIWYLVQGHHNPDYDLQRACQIWFGRGVQYDGMTWREYHEKVKTYLITYTT